MSLVKTLQIVKNMQNVAENYNGDVNEAGIQTAKTFSWQNTAREIIKCLKN